jgi:site-specific recombinase XerD
MSNYNNLKTKNETSFEPEKYSEMTFNEAIDMFIKLKDSECRKSTVAYYKGKIPVIRKQLGNMLINKIDEHNIADFTLYLKTRKTNPSEKTINKYRNIVAQIIKRITGRKIKIVQLKEKVFKVEGISDNNIHKIFNYYSTNLDKFNNLKYYLITRLLYDTGVRINELIQIHPASIDLQSRCIYLPNSKTGDPRYVFFTGVTERLLQEYLNRKLASSDYLFPGWNGLGHITAESIYRVLQRLQKRLDINQSISAHKWRHTFAQNYLKKGGNTATLQKLLGHSDLRTTEMYLKFNKEYLKNMYDKYMGKENNYA